MAIDNPFDFGTEQAAPEQAPGGLQQQWQNFLDQGGRTAIMQVGLQMMQPIGFGETPLSNAAKGVGLAGEALSDRSLLDQRERRTQIADETAQRRLDIQEEKLRMARERGTGGRTRSSAAAPRGRTLDPLASDRLEIARSREERLSGKKGIQELFEGGGGAPVPFQRGGVTAAENVPPKEPKVPKAAGNNPRLDAIFQSARDAIASGAPADAVRARLKAKGIDPSGI